MGSKNTARKRVEAVVEPRSCKEKPTTKRKKGKTTQQEERKGTEEQNQRKKEQQGQQEPASIQRMFDLAIEGSDAESKVDLRLSGVPPWESQRVCTNELIGQDLVGLENQGRHP